MKTRMRLATAFALGLGVLSAGTASAETVYGTIRFVGTLGAESFRVHVSPSTCSSDPSPKDRWLQVPASDNPIHLANFRNAYNTAMAAYLSGNTAQFDGVPSCTSHDQVIPFADLSLGIYK